MAGMGEMCDHVAVATFRIKAVVRTGFTNPSWTISANEWLQCRKDHEPTIIKDLNFDKEDFAQCGKKKRPLVQRKNSTR